MPKRYPSEFRRKVLDLVASDRRVAQVAADLDNDAKLTDDTGRGRGDAAVQHVESVVDAVAPVREPVGRRSASAEQVARGQGL
jgi:hypothetical protein